MNDGDNNDAVRDDLSSDEELLLDPDVLQLKHSMRVEYHRELSDARRIIYELSERIDGFLLPYIGFSLFLAPERHFNVSRFAALGVMLFATLLLAFAVGAGKLFCVVFTTAYPLYQCFKFLRDGGADGSGSAHDAAERNANRGAGAGGAGASKQHSYNNKHARKNAFVQWGTYWVIVGTFEVAEQVVTNLFFSTTGLHWFYWYVKLLVLFYCYFPRTQAATLLYWKVANWRRRQRRERRRRNRSTRKDDDDDGNDNDGGSDDGDVDDDIGQSE